MRSKKVALHFQSSGHCPLGNGAPLGCWGITTGGCSSSQRERRSPQGRFGIHQRERRSPQGRFGIHKHKRARHDNGVLPPSPPNTVADAISRFPEKAATCDEDVVASSLACSLTKMCSRSKHHVNDPVFWQHEATNDTEVARASQVPRFH